MALTPIGARPLRRGAGLLLIVVAVAVMMNAVPVMAQNSVEECRAQRACKAGNTMEYDGAANPSCRCCLSDTDGNKMCTAADYFCPTTQTNCATCDAGGACTSCNGGLALVAGRCQRCTVTNCQECLRGNGRQCGVCNDNYNWQGEERCVRGTPNTNPPPCSAAYCDFCNPSFSAICSRCAPFFLLQSTGTCSSQCNVQDCQICTPQNTTQCLLCVNGYGPTTEGLACRTVPRVPNPCRPSNCRRCEASTTARCAECIRPYLRDAAGLCRKCIAPNCVRCSARDPTKCDRCADYYVLSNTKQCVAQPCDVPGCVYCRMNNRNVCELCSNTPNGVPVNGKCQGGTSSPGSCNVANCQACEAGNANRCRTCRSGYVTNSAGQCSAVGKCRVHYCAECQPGDSVRCRRCVAGYGLTTAGTCIRRRNPSAAGTPPQALIIAAGVMAATAFFGML